MTLAEFIAPLVAGTNEDRILAVLYFFERYRQIASSTVEEIRKGLKDARVRRAGHVNVADVLSKSGAFVDTVGTKGRSRLWALTDTGRKHVRELLGLPEADIEVEHDTGVLFATIAGISDADVRAYLEEGLKCLRVGALRACVVFVWVGAARAIQSQLLAKGPAAATAAIQKHDPKARAVHTLDDFAYVKESVVLLAAKDLGIFDKNEKDAIGEALDLRNRCGHPGKYKPGPKKVSAFLEDLTSIIFS